MKRTAWLNVIALVLCFAMVFSLSACGKKKADAPSASSVQGESVIADSSSDDTEATPESAEEPVSEEVEDPRAAEAVDMDDGVDDLDLDAMARVDAAINDLIKDESFLAAEVKDRVTMVTEMLAKFVETGDVEKDSIFYEDGSDVVSFSYKGGALGGVMVTEWDANMNGTHTD